jgi:hypothetical protein
MDQLTETLKVTVLGAVEKMVENMEEVMVVVPVLSTTNRGLLSRFDLGQQKKLFNFLLFFLVNMNTHLYFVPLPHHSESKKQRI